jgi:putative transcriptional regulator
MIRFLRLVATLPALASLGLMPSWVSADRPVSSNLEVKLAPDGRPPGYSLARGMFLIASRGLTDPNFSESVVLLLEYDAQGALGLIVNRPTRVQLTDLLPEVDELKERGDVVYVGGPVSKNRIVLLMRSDRHPREAGRVFADTYVSSSMETLRHAIALSREGGTFHAYVGYAGWGPGQLDSEVSRGDWHISPAEEAIVFDKAAEEIWPELIEKSAGRWVRAPADPLLVAGARP